MTDEKRKGLGAHPITEGIVSAIRNNGSLYGAAVESVSSAVRGALAAAHRAGSSAVGAVTVIALGATRGVLEIGANLAEASKGIVVGVLQGSGDRGEAGLRTISHVARTVLHHTAMTESDVAGATTGLIEGALQSAPDLDVEATLAARAAAQGALEGAEEVGFAAAEQVRAASTAPFPGLRFPLLPRIPQQGRT